MGRLVYFFGYPLFRILIRGTTRAYVIVRVGDEILLTKNWLGFQKKWRLPGGGVHSGEKPEVAAIRELKEEIGLSANDSEMHLVQAEPFASSFKYQYYLFVLHLNKKPEVVADEREILVAKFFPIADIAKITISEEVSNFLKLAK